MYHAQVTSVVPANLGTFTVPVAALAYLPPSGTWQIEITAAVNQGGAVSYTHLDVYKRQGTG